MKVKGYFRIIFSKLLGSSFGCPLCFVPLISCNSLTEDGEDERVSELLEAFPANYGLNDFDRLLPSRFPKLEYRPLLLIAVDSDQEEIAILLIGAGASFHVAGKVN